MERTKEVVEIMERLDKPKVAREAVEKGISDVPGLREYIIKECQDVDFFCFETREINADFLSKKPKCHYDDSEENNFFKEKIIALSIDGEVLGEVDNIPLKNENKSGGFSFWSLQRIESMIRDFCLCNESPEPAETVLKFLKRTGGDIDKISSIVKLVPTGKIRVYKTPKEFKNLSGWLNSNGKKPQFKQRGDLR